MTTFLGIDVSSRWLDIASADEVVNIANTPSAIKQWLATLNAPAAIAMEATGIYYRLCAELAVEAGCQVFVLNPRIIHHYAKSVGRRVKNDPVDAQVIRRYLVHEYPQLHAWTPPTKAQERIDTLLNRRALLVSKRQSIKMACQDIADYCQGLNTALNALASLIDELEKLIVQALREDTELTQRFRLLQSIPGVGTITAAYMTNLLSRHQFKHSHQLTSYIGLDLVYADSGLKKGRRRLSKQGSSEARRLLFNCARSASMGQLKIIYSHYANRMNHTQATVAMMRKLVKLILGIWKSGEAYSAEKFGSPLLNA